MLLTSFYYYLTIGEIFPVIYLIPFCLCELILFWRNDALSSPVKSLFTCQLCQLSVSLCSNCRCNHLCLCWDLLTKRCQSSRVGLPAAKEKCRSHMLQPRSKGNYLQPPLQCCYGEAINLNCYCLRLMCYSFPS